MHIAVCDDNVADRKQMERLLNRASDRRIHTTGVFYIDSYGNVDAVMRSPMLYDAFFIDMTSGPVNGFMLARRLIDAGVISPIILCVSTIDYRAIIDVAISKIPRDAVESSDHDILRKQLQTQILFIDKPIKVAELEEKLDYAIDIKKKAIPTIELRGDKETVYVYEEEIICANRLGNYTRVMLTQNRSIDLLTTPANLHLQICEFKKIVAVSPNALVNITHISKLSLTKVTLINGETVPIFPTKYKELKAVWMASLS